MPTIAKQANKLIKEKKKLINNARDVGHFQAIFFIAFASMSQAPRQSKWTMKIFQQAKNSPTSVALWGMKADLRTRAAYLPPYCAAHDCWRMTESNLTEQTVHLPHQGTVEESLKHSGPDHLQQTSSRPLQAGPHGYHCHMTAMEMDLTCDEKTAGQHFPHSPALDTRGEAENEGDPITPGIELNVQKLAQNRQEWGTFGCLIPQPA